MVGVKQYRLMDENGQFYMDTVPGKFGGYRRGRIPSVCCVYAGEVPGVERENRAGEMKLVILL